MRSTNSTLRALIMSVLGALTPGFAPAALPLTAEGQALPSLAPMLSRATPAVLNVATRGHVEVQQNPLLSDPFFRRFFDVPDQPRFRETQSLGSGVIVDAARGYVLTNSHVIDKADEITVNLRDGRKLNAKLVGSDPESDVAVIQIPSERLVALPMANSDNLRVGDFVVAIGNPFGLGQTVTSGIVSALGRTGLGIEGYENFIQTDASINPGNSGGALVNLRGELIGINTAILAPSGGNIGIGFAIPINMARHLMTQIVTHGAVKRGQLGVSTQDLTPELAQAFNIAQTQGSVIAAITPGSPAAKAGLRIGDVITAVNGRKVESSAQVRNIVGLLRVGEKIVVDVIRDGKPLRLSAKVGEPAQADSMNLHPGLKGAVYRDLQAGSPAYGQLTGVEIAQVESGSPAARAGLRPGDIIVSVNRRRIANLSEFQQFAAPQQARLLLNVRRGNGAFFVIIE